MSTHSIINALRDPTCYRHRTGEIRVIETHISWVVLTGEFAYKIKKPVRLDFLDFTTLSRRRHFCEEEIRLNRRFAPGLYLGLSRITAGRHGLRVDDEDGTPVVEYAVKLRQFDSGAELTALLDDGAADASLLREFGRELAGVHEAAPRVQPGADFGSVETTLDTVRTNLGELGQQTLPAAESARVERLRDRMLALGEQLSDRLAARRRNGFVRECHGDLHAGNVVRLDGRLVAFDCIEFDPALRIIDVANDVAFLHMDLCARDREDLAYTLLDGWLERTGDFGGIEVLRYYAAHRALVRAKVTAIARASGQHRKPDTSAYLRTADKALQPAAPLLAITIGLSGSGKTWLSNQLVAQLPCVRIRSDVERKRLVGLAATASSRSLPGAGLYSREFNARTYSHLLASAAQALRGGYSTLIDAAFLRYEERAAARRLAAELGTPFVQLLCEAPTEALRARVQRRSQEARDASEATLDVLERQLDYFEPPLGDELAGTVTIDTTARDAATRALDAISRYLGQAAGSR